MSPRAAKATVIGPAEFYNKITVTIITIHSLFQGFKTLSLLLNFVIVINVSIQYVILMVKPEILIPHILMILYLL